MPKIMTIGSNQARSRLWWPGWYTGTFVGLAAANEVIVSVSREAVVVVSWYVPGGVLELPETREPAGSVAIVESVVGVDVGKVDDSRDEAIVEPIRQIVIPFNKKYPSVHVGCPAVETGAARTWRFCTEIAFDVLADVGKGVACG